MSKVTYKSNSKPSTLDIATYITHKFGQNVVAFPVNTEMVNEQYVTQIMVMH